VNGTTITGIWYTAPPSPAQAQVLGLVSLYVEHFKRPCSASVIADALGRERSTIREHFEALHRKGWLVSNSSKAVPRPKN
jgi:predicted ArsR family transcriptional regulator